MARNEKAGLMIEELSTKMRDNQDIVEMISEVRLDERNGAEADPIYHAHVMMGGKEYLVSVVPTDLQAHA
jgi:hypothetical protein